MKKILLLAVFITSNLVAQETTTNVSPATTSDTSSTFSFSGLLDDLRESPFSLSFINELGSTRASDNGVNGFYNDFNAYFSYKLSDNDSFRFNTGFYSSDAVGEADATSVQWSGAGLRYKRSGILNQDAHGVDMSAEVRLNMFNEFWVGGDIIGGSYSIRGNFVRKIVEKVEVFTQLRYDEYLRSSNAPKLTRRKIVALVAPYYHFAKDWYVSPTISFNFYMKGDLAAPSKTNKIGFAPEVGYTINKDMSVGAYWDSTPFMSNDGKFLAGDFQDKSVFAMYLTYNLF